MKAPPIARTVRAALLSTILCGGGLALAADAANIDWSKITASKVALFYPGQSSYEWLRGSGHKGAFREVKRGESCAYCHDEDGAEADMGEANVKGGRLEPTPIAGKRGSVDLSVQAAFDNKNAYIRFQWKSDGTKPGTEQPYLRFDGKQWKPWGQSRLDKAVQDGQQPAIHEDRVSMMIDDGRVAGFAQQGCWLTCHDGLRDMPPQQPPKDGVLATVRKYLPDSRTDPSDWSTRRTAAEIAKLLRDGKFLDLIQWRAYSTSAVAMAHDGHVLESRNTDAGTSAFSTNADDNQNPLWMWNEKVTGFKSIREDSPARNGQLFLVRGQNTVAFDPRAAWKEGDLIPGTVSSREQAKGSTADSNALASWANGMWTVVVVRPLDLPHADDKALKAGGVYNVGFAVHDDNVGTRAHHVSFVKTLGLGVKADIQAVALP